MRERPHWAFDKPTVLDRIPGVEGPLGLLLSGSVALVMAQIFGATNFPASAVVAKVVAITSIAVLIYASLRLAFAWLKYRLSLRAVGTPARQTQAGNGTSFIDLMTERNSFLG